MTRPLALLTLLFASSCATTVQVTHLTPPEASLGSVHTLSVEVTTDTAQAVTSALANGLINGELPLPLDVKDGLKQRLVERLGRLGATVCSEPHCGDAALKVTFREMALAAAGTDHGVPQLRVRLDVHYLITRTDTLRLMDMSAWERRQASALNTEDAVNNALDRLANSFTAAFLPRRQTASLPLDDGGDLQPGVDALLSGNPDQAEQLFNQLIASSPNHAGAHYNLGVVYEVRGDWAHAALSYRRAVDLADRARYRAAAEEAATQAARAMR